MNKEAELINLYAALEPISESLIAFEKALYTHVRWEERILFEAIQEKYAEAELLELIPQENALADWCQLYTDQFWD